MKFEVKIPTVGESISEVIIAKWLVQNETVVKTDQPICQIESEKATIDIPAPNDGVIQIQAREGETYSVNDVIAIIDNELVPSESPIQPEKSPEPNSNKKERISPVAAKLMESSNLTAGDVKGTGPGGRITKDDVLDTIKHKETKPASLEPAQVISMEIASNETKVIPQLKSEPATNRNVRREKMTTLRKTISRRLVEAKNSTAMLTTFNEVDMTQLIAIRQKYKDIFQEKYKIRLGFMSLFSRAASIALMENPGANARIEGEEIIYNDFVDLSIAVSTPRGLVTPVVRNAEKMSFAQLETEIARLAAKARDGKLSIDEMTGGTFTITNGGVFGSLLSTPLLNIPQSAILGMHKIQDRPVALNGQVIIRPMMYLALSYDHRIIDGRESVLFLVRMKELLEDPDRMLLLV